MRTLLPLGLLGLLSLVVVEGGCTKPDPAATAKCKGQTSSKIACKECCKSNGLWGYEYVVGVTCECSKN